MNNKSSITTDELHPLKWPDGWERTRVKERKSQSQWKRTKAQYKDALVNELKRMGATDVLISYNIGNEFQDPGVAVYFSRSIADKFGWQDALGIDNPAPTVAEIDAAFKAKAMPYHPDRPGGGDAEIFKELNKHRQAAIAWVRGEHTKEHEYVIACDRFDEIRLNICGIRLVISALRTIERIGVSAVLERTFRGFRTALPAHASNSEVVNEPVRA